MKRYRMYARLDDIDRLDAGAEENNNGDWLKYSEVSALLDIVKKALIQCNNSFVWLDVNVKAEDDDDIKYFIEKGRIAAREALDRMKAMENE